jgi:hypothetical protein
MPIDCINPRRDSRFVEPVPLVEATASEHDSLLIVAFESFFIFLILFVVLPMLQNGLFTG